MTKPRMTKPSMTKSLRPAFRPTSDHALGAAGCGLAVASAAFGIGMMLHGPAGSFGASGGFTVFAQLAPHHAVRDHAGAAAETLDMTATASIRKPQADPPDAIDATVIPAVTLEAVGPDSATVAIDGRTRVVRVGDDVPGAGRVVAIVPGARPALRTSRGLIVPAAE